jgi:hypothetical protein
VGDEQSSRVEGRSPLEVWFFMSVDFSDAAGKPKLLEVVRERLRAGYYSIPDGGGLRGVAG